MECGTFVYDEVAGVVGEFRGSDGPYAMLRPVGGGREWQADPAQVRPATQAERLSAGVRAVNDRTRAAANAYLDRELPPLPVPVKGCGVCDDLAELRRKALLRYDGSAESDTIVRLRPQLAQVHAGGCRAPGAGCQTWAAYWPTLYSPAGIRSRTLRRL
jgi:hypothetical protein